MKVQLLREEVTLNIATPSLLCAAFAQILLYLSASYFSSMSNAGLLVLVDVYARTIVSIAAERTQREARTRYYVGLYTTQTAINR